MEDVYKNDDDMPISDILTEIRQLVSAETNKRYSRDREKSVTELLILRPETRIDLVLQETAKSHRVAVPANIVVKTLGIGSKDELRALIREVFIEEFDNWSKS